MYYTETVIFELGCYVLLCWTISKRFLIARGISPSSTRVVVGSTGFVIMGVMFPFVKFVIFPVVHDDY